MSDLNSNTHRDYSIFDSMSTKELENILRSDSQLSDIKNSDLDAILYVMEVIAKREKENSTGRFRDINKSWKSFNENYLPYIKDNKSLYDYDDNENQTTVEQLSPVRKYRRTIRVACILAIITSLFLTGSITAKAFGIDLWGTVAKWTKDTFGFSVPNKAETQQTTSIKSDTGFEEMLFEYGITSDLVPTWLPEGYLLNNIDVAETPARTTFLATYKDQNNEILITIASLYKKSTSAYEKDNKELIVYKVNSIEHYIMTNIEKVDIVWKWENFECSITGEFSVEEAEKMINSIYERN